MYMLGNSGIGCSKGLLLQTKSQNFMDKGFVCVYVCVSVYAEDMLKNY
jgi:hypothetical protein